MAYRLAETFGLSGDRLTHELTVGEAVLQSTMPRQHQGGLDDHKSAWWKAYLGGGVPSPVGGFKATIRAVDLFCGVGGLALGLQQLAADAGWRVVTELIVDQDAGAVDVYATNHSTRLRYTRSVRALVDFRVRGWGRQARFTYPPEILDQKAGVATRNVDVLMAGPPCQGHSNLNNHSRREDKRNLLYLTVPAFAVAVGAQSVIIENVPAVVHDRTGVVDSTMGLFLSEGYQVSSGVLAADGLGWPQTRHRFFMVARREGHPIKIKQVAHQLFDEQRRSVLWAIGSMTSKATGLQSLMDDATEHSQENQERINWLFDNSEYDLPNHQRPQCHQAGTTYNAAYGRMKPNHPAPTITTGFTSPGRGRFIHPTKRRTLTPREAAVIQGFPYGYQFITDTGHPPNRSQLAKWIGDAVPMPLGYMASLAALGPDMKESV